MSKTDTTDTTELGTGRANPARAGASHDRASHGGLALLVICAGYFLVILDATVVNVALPAIGRELHAGVAGLQWVVDAYTLSFAGLLLAGGTLAERLGGRRVFAAGLALFALASAACGAAPSLPVLVAARLVQGAGAAALVPASLVLLQAAYPTAAGRSRALGAWGSIAGIGAASGPVIGGLLVTTWSWRGVFLISVPFAAAALAATRRCVPAPPRRARALDLPGQLLAVAALALATGALVQAGRLGWTSVPVLAGLAASALAGAGFVAAERHSRDPMLPLALFRRPAFRSGTAVGLLINLGFYGQLFVLSLYFQDVRGYSALRAGLALLPEAALLIAASTLSGAVMARVGPRRPMLAGLLIGGAGLAGLAAAATHAGYPLLVAPMAAAGFGMALTMPAATASVLEAAPADRGGIASGVVNAARQTGGVLGVALLGTLVSGSSFTAGLPVALAVAAAAFCAGAALVLMGGRGSAERGSADPHPG
jgi:DHA2 family methylenomycin A resistance protein-like MFS transporter